MAISIETMRNNTYRLVAVVMWCGLLQGQTAIPVPVVPAAAVSAPASAPVSVPAASHATLHVTELPDSTMPLSSSTLSVSQPLHILVGQSIFISTVTRLKRVYVSDPTVVDSFTSSPRQIVVTAKAPGVSSLILWDQAGDSATYWVSSDVNVGICRRRFTRRSRMTIFTWKGSRTGFRCRARCLVMLRRGRRLNWPAFIPRT